MKPFNLNQKNPNGTSFVKIRLAVCATETVEGTHITYTQLTLLRFFSAG